MNKRKFLLLCLTLCSIFMTLCLVTETYAKYVTNTTSSTNADIAKWKILLNNTDVTLGATSNAVITPIFPGQDDIRAGVIAPNAEGYFDIVLDVSEVDVSINYTITVQPHENANVTEIIPTKYQIDGGDLIDFSGINSFSENIDLRNNVETVNIRIYIKWDDSLEDMTNQEDTEASKKLTTKIDVILRAIQVNNT